ncbi:M48 family metallopeptidase [Acinetobacter indicus]|uniref:M48 family metallopeptidase n=1 Tax=Acinetobacter indicus TaxID=756892 RepID=UPI002578944B|nr:M48 family metallopeptidase [Acinetobacter indicus]MDM1281717.1 M48 family metallopeptidase [Acinetobacter indicus]
MQQMTVEAVFYDGQSAKPYTAQVLAADADSIWVQYGENFALQRRYRYQDMLLIGALGRIQPVIELQDDARLEFQQPLPDWFQLQQKNIYQSIWKLERTPSLILFSTIFIVALAFATVKWGIPWASHVVANQLPETTLNSVGNEAEHYVLEMTGPSRLSAARQQEILQQYQALVAEDRPAKLLFREGNRLGANAVAIPSNTIILTDELVELAQDDREILGVLAHEQGHLVERHSLQQALASLGFGVILIAITGDGSDLMTSLPLALVGASYSRNFEAEADHYALTTMQHKQVPTIHYANLLQRLADESGESEQGKSVWDFLQSHPATQERIEAVKAFEAKQSAEVK